MALIARLSQCCSLPFISHLSGNLVNREEVFLIQDAVSKSISKTPQHDKYINKIFSTNSKQIREKKKQCSFTSELSSCRLSQLPFSPFPERELWTSDPR